MPGEPVEKFETRIDFYNMERSQTPAYSSSQETWVGAIGLMYLSDYEYAANGEAATCDNTPIFPYYYEIDIKPECIESSWLYDSRHTNWTITSRHVFSWQVIVVDKEEYVSLGTVYSEEYILSLM